MILVSVYLPRIGIAGPVPFLVDTGADFTVLHPFDSSRLGIHFASDFLDATVARSTGVGGLSNEYLEHGLFFLEHSNEDIDEIEVSVRIALPTNTNRRLPSLLGRDLLRNYRFTFEEVGGLVTLERVRNRSGPRS